MEPFQLQQEASIPLFFLSKWMQNYPYLTVGFTTRLGGFSQGAYDSLNCGLHVYDQPENVIANRRKLADQVDISFDAWTYAEQIHGNEVSIVDEKNQGAGRLSMDKAVKGKDGLVTNNLGTSIALMYADCVPLYFFDPIHKVIGMAHAGWKGTASEIASSTINIMEEQYGSQREQLLAAIGPSIGKCCYEVDSRLMKAMQNIEPTITDNNTIAETKTNGKYMLDLKEVNRQIMLKAGILPTNIELSQLCTSCHAEWFFSHRRDQGKSGRMVAWIGIKED